jgi:hypothetical protein
LELGKQFGEQERAELPELCQLAERSKSGEELSEFRQFFERKKRPEFTKLAEIAAVRAKPELGIERGRPAIAEPATRRL